MMVRLNKKDLQALALWGVVYRDSCIEVGLQPDKDEDATLVKIGRARDKAWKYQKGLFERNSGLILKANL
jgi:hypothetical protein